MGIKKWFSDLTTKIGIQIAKIVSPVIRDIMDHPEKLRFEGYMEKDAIIIRITTEEES